MIDIKTLRAMAEAGCSVQVILAAVEAELRAEGERVQARRDRDAVRQREWRASHSKSHPVTVTNSDNTVSLSSLLSSSISTTNTQEKKVSKKERARKSLLPVDWQPSEGHYTKAAAIGMANHTMHQKADDMRHWAASKGIMRADWDATFYGFLRPKEGYANGNHRQSLSDMARDLADEARELERAAGIGGSATVVGSDRPGSAIDPRLPEWGKGRK